MTGAPKRRGRPIGSGGVHLPPSEVTKPRSIRLNDTRWDKLRRLGRKWWGHLVSAPGQDAPTQARIEAEARKLLWESLKLRSEQRKLEAEEAKFRTETRWHWAVVGAALFGAGALFIKLLERAL